MKKGDKRGKIEAISLIVNLVVAVVAFSFILNSVIVIAYKVGDTRKIDGNTWKRNSVGMWSTNAKGYESTLLGDAFIAEKEKGLSRSASPNPIGTLNAVTGIKTIKIGEKFLGITNEGSLGGIEYAVGSDGKNYMLENNLWSQVDNLPQGLTLQEAYAEAPSPYGTIGWFGASAAGNFFNYVVAGALWAGTVYGAVHILGSMLGFEPEKVNAVATAAAVGTFAGFALKGIFPKVPVVPIGGGILIGLIVLELMYKETSQRIVTFECYPWEAPEGGANCEKCNSELLPCTEYRCKSLGQACELLNPGTGKEKCAWVNPRDVNSPIIQPMEEALSKEHKYVPDDAIRPPDRGVKIKYLKASDGCVKAFTPLEFGVKLNEPAQCKIDYVRKGKYEEMTYFFGGSNIYEYNHTQTLRLPGPDSINAEAPELKADGTYSLYVRCQDANKNANDDLFVFSFCVEKGPDVTAPKIEGTSIANEMPIQYGLTETELEVYVNEPSQCKWSRTDQDFEQMENSMSCSQHVYEMNNMMLYKCLTTLTDLEDHKDNIFYFRCKDQPYAVEEDRNTNKQGYKFILKGTQALNIVNIKPNGTITGYSTLATIWLELETEAGYNFGDSWCSYSLTGEEDSWIKMAETGTNKHKQRQDLSAGNYKYYFQCADLGNNAAYDDTTFSVEIDAEAPVVVRVYQDGSKLKIITNEKSVCSYSTNEDKQCSFAIEEGNSMPYADSKEHYADWEQGKTYYVKCKDANERQPLPNECSIIVKAES